MKKIIALSIVVAPYFAFAQFSKGQIYVGGSIATSLQNSNYNYGNNSLNKSIYNSFSITPAIGFFLNPHISIGGSMGYSSYLQELDYGNNTFNKSQSHSFSINSIARYYFPLANSVYVAIQGQISFERGGTEYSNESGLTGKNPFYNVGLSFRPIFVFFPSPAWGIEAGVGSLGYNYQRYLPDVSSTNSFSINAGSFSFGLAYYFAKK